MKSSSSAVLPRKAWVQAASVLVAGTGLFTLSSCAFQQKPSQALGPTGTDVINHPERHVGEQVSIRGTVNAVYSRGSFTVGPESFLKTDLRVVARGPERDIPLLRAGDRVRVEGVVRTFRRREFLAGYATGFYGAGSGFYGYGSAYQLSPGFYGLGTGSYGGYGYPTYYTTWEERPVIIAHRVERRR